MSEPKPDVPIFDFKRHFDTTVEIADRTLPIHVKRFTRKDWLEFKKKWDALMSTPPGIDTLSPEDRATRNAEQLAFMEDTIVGCITLDEGYLRVDGEWVTNGDGLIDVFYARRDVLSSLMAKVFIENTLQPIFLKNSNSPRASDDGSAQSLPTRGGVEQGPTATSAENSSSAASAPVTEDPGSSEGSQSSSGATLASDEPIVH